MRLNPPKLTGDRAQHLASRRELDIHQLLGRAVPGELVVDRRRVIHAVDDRHVLVVIEMLAELFETAVQVADVRDRADDALAVEFKDESQGRMRRRMLRAKIERPSIPPALGAFGKEFGGRLLERVRHKVRDYSGEARSCQTSRIVLEHVADIGLTNACSSALTPSMDRDRSLLRRMCELDCRLLLASVDEDRAGSESIFAGLRKRARRSRCSACSWPSPP